MTYFSLLMSGALLISPVCTFAQSDQIKLNQAGFYPKAPKRAVVAGKVPASDFYITSADLKDTVFTGSLSGEKQSAFSTTTTRIADFSALVKKGNFVVLIPGAGHSYVFRIDDDINRNIGIATLKGYYYQRASMPLEEKYAGKWHRAAGHPDTAVYIHPSAADGKRPEGTVIASPGGWYDAGDYNKYIVNSGITIGTLLSAYEDFPGYFKKINTNIPESNDAVPDILNEVIYNLRWMLTMQDPHDGGVYHKCTNPSFDKMVMPDSAKAPRYAVQKGTAATLDLAAVAAQASRILKKYKKQLPGLADSCLNASRKAWGWAMLHPSVAYNQNALNDTFLPLVVTGAYGDRNFKDEWLWAATELYITTKEKGFYTVAEQHMKDTVNLPGWANVGMLAYYSFLRQAAGQPVSTAIKKHVLGIADRYIEKVTTNAFGTVMGQSARDFNWGGNANAANQGILLIRAYLLTGDKKYVDHAVSNMDYLLGRNATGYSFVTGIGSKVPMFPHHRPSAADGIEDPVPGLLVGGPNAAMQDKCRYEFTEAETAYSDVTCSYASNEIAINWNAPVVYLANALEALKGKVGYVVGE